MDSFTFTLAKDAIEVIGEALDTAPLARRRTNPVVAAMQEQIVAQQGAGRAAQAAPQARAAGRRGGCARRVCGRVRHRVMSKRTWKLTKNQKAYIVVRLACYNSPAAIRKSLKEDFGIEITPQALERYNPTRSTGRACPEQWATLFYETRRKLVEGRVGYRRCAQDGAHTLARPDGAPEDDRRKDPGGARPAQAGGRGDEPDSRAEA